MKKILLIALLALSAQTFAQEPEHFYFNKTKAPNLISIGKTPGVITIHKNFLYVKYSKRKHQFMDFTWIVEKIEEDVYASRNGNIIYLNGNSVHITGMEKTTLAYTKELYNVTYYNK